MNGIQIALEILFEAGVRHLFGNPGTTELPLNAALRNDSRFQYLFGLHEIPVMGMADGWAMATRKLAVVNLHVACGLGNAMGMLYNAFIEGTPLLVTTGAPDRKLAMGDPVLAGPMLAMAKPCTKYAAEVTRLEDLPDRLRHAVQAALTPPTGPVFLSIPLDIQLELAEELACHAPHALETRLRPARAAVDAAAAQLLRAARPVILAGSRVMEAQADRALAQLAERLGAPIFSEATPSHGRLPIVPSHPLYAGPLSPWHSDVQQQLAHYDTILAIGLNVMRWYIHEPIDQVFPDHSSLIHLDVTSSEIGRNYRTDVGVWGDLQESLSELNEQLAARWTAEHSDRAAQRGSLCVEQIKRRRDTLREEVTREMAGPHLTSKGLMGALASALPREIVIVEEAITTHQHLFEHLEIVHRAENFFAHRGWGLGWGIGCALGVKLAWPDRPVLALIGDGAAMYGIQGLWSAAHHQLPVVFVIAKNGQYQILKQCGDRLDLSVLRDPACPGMNLDRPSVDFVQLSESLGVRATRVDSAPALRDAVAQALSRNEPYLIEAVVNVN